MMSLKSLFIPKEMWACSGHPKTESFRVSPDVYKSGLNTMCIYTEANDAISEAGNCFESESPSAASTSEGSSSEDSGEASELLVEGIVRGLRSDRFFFEPERTKSIVEEGKEKRNCLVPFLKVENGLEREKGAGFLLVKESKKVASGLQDEKKNEFFLFKENKKVGDNGLARPKRNEVFLFKENKKMGSGLERETGDDFLSLTPDNVKLVAGFKKKTCGGLLTLGEQLQIDNSFEMKEDDISDEFVLSHRESTKKASDSPDFESKKHDDFFVCDTVEMDLEMEKNEWLLGFDERDGAEVLGFDESMIMVMDSYDPYKDFRVSMEEMVESYGVGEWECLEEMLMWYLKANERNAHSYIMGAFADLLISIVSSSQEMVMKSGKDFDELTIKFKELSVSN